MSEHSSSSAAEATDPRISRAERRLKCLRLKQQLAEARIRLARAERQAKAEELRTAHWWPREPNPGAAVFQENLARKRDHQRELLEAKRAGKELQEANFLWDWVSGYQDLIDRLRSPDGLLLSAISIAADRRYGACWPFFRTWQELALLRGAARILYQTSTLARGVVSGLQSYIIGDGFQYRVTEREGCPAGLRLACQEILDEYSDINDWPALEAELVRRDVRDGEWYVRSFPQGDGTTVERTFGPEQLIQPAGSKLEEWSFGKRNPTGEEHDVQKVLEYAVCYDGDNSHPVKVPASEVIEHTCNVDRDVKRGIPDLAYDTYDFLKVAGRLIENMAEGSAVQASVAEIRQWKGPVTGDQASDFAASEADYQMTNPWTGNQQNVRQVRPGDVRDIPEGMEYVPPPFTQGSTIFIAVEQAVLRAAAVTWNAPEWLTSGDASNNNYSSSLTAESPFVKTGTRKQNVDYKPRFVCARWRALRNYCEAKGGIVALGTKYDWAAVQKYVDIQCEPPSMEVRNKLDEAQANAVRVQSGWKSRQTAAQEEGLDWEQEMANIEEYNERTGGMGAQLPMPGDDDQGGSFGGFGGGGGGGNPPSLGEGLIEEVLREEGFTGTITDRRGRKVHYVNGQRVKAGGAATSGTQARKKAQAAAQAHAELVQKAQAKLAADVKQMGETPAGKETLSKGQQLAAKVKEKVASGVKQALDGIDADSGGGLSLLAGVLKTGDPKAAAAGAAQLTSSVFRCVHEEMFELMLSQQTHGPAFAAKLAAKVAAKSVSLAESGLFKAALWAWVHAIGKASESLLRESADQLTDADRELLRALAEVAGDALRDMLGAAGADAEIDLDVLAQRLAGMLRGKGE